MEKSLVKDLKISWHEATLRIQAAKKQVGFSIKGVMSVEEKECVLQKAKSIDSSELKGLKKKATSSTKKAQEMMQQDMQKFKEKKVEQRLQQYDTKRQAELTAFAEQFYKDLNYKEVKEMSLEEKEEIFQRAKALTSSELTKGLKKGPSSKKAQQMMQQDMQTKGASTMNTQQKMEQDRQKFKEKKAEQQKQQRYAERQAEEVAMAGIMYRSSMAKIMGNGEAIVPINRDEYRVEKRYWLELERIHKKYNNLFIAKPESGAALGKMEEELHRHSKRLRDMEQRYKLYCEDQEEWEEQRRKEKLSIWKK